MYRVVRGVGAAQKVRNRSKRVHCRSRWLWGCDLESRSERRAMESKRLAGQQPLRVCLVDMNNGHENQAMRCLRLIATQFHGHAAKWNPGLELRIDHVSTRDKG